MFNAALVILYAGTGMDAKVDDLLMEPRVVDLYDQYSFSENGDRPRCIHVRNNLPLSLSQKREELFGYLMGTGNIRIERIIQVVPTLSVHVRKNHRLD